MDKDYIKHINLEELKVLYKDIVELTPEEFIIIKTDFEDSNLQGLQSIVLNTNEDFKNSTDEFIVNQSKHFLIEENRLNGFNITTLVVHENFILNKNISYTLGMHICDSMLMNEKCFFVKLKIKTIANKIIELVYERKDIIANNTLAVSKEVLITNDLIIGFAIKIEEDIESVMKSFYKNNKLETIISKSEKLQEYNPGLKGAYETDLYYQVYSETGAKPLIIKANIIKEFEAANPEESNLLVNVKKVIRLTKEEFDSLTDEDKLIYNNIEKYLQFYTTKGIKFDSVMATIRYLEQVTEKVKSKKVSRISKSLKATLNTFKLHYVVIDENYERKNQCEHFRSGHYRHYKNGNVIYIDKYKAGRDK